MIVEISFKKNKIDFEIQKLLVSLPAELYRIVADSSTLLNAFKRECMIRVQDRLLRADHLKWDVCHHPTGVCNLSSMDGIYFKCLREVFLVTASRFSDTVKRILIYFTPAHEGFCAICHEPIESTAGIHMPCCSGVMHHSCYLCLSMYQNDTCPYCRHTLLNLNS